jgi:hypothetical protein
MAIDKFDKTIDAIQASLVWFVVGIITICIAVLFLFDVLAGTGTMLWLTNGKAWQSVVISLATTGLLFALMFIGYMMLDKGKGFIMNVGKGILVTAFLIYVEDVIFDALLADILRYGSIIPFAQVDSIQWLFRILLGGISTVGDAIAVAMVIGMPVLKTIIGEAVQPKSNSVPAKPQYQAHLTSRLPQKTQTETRPHPFAPQHGNTVTYPAVQRPAPVSKPYNGGNRIFEEPTYHPIGNGFVIPTKDMDDDE